MTMSEMDSFLAQGREKHLLLLQEATDLLAKMDHISMEDLTALLERRQTIIEWIQGFDARIAAMGASGPGARAAVEEFKIFQEETVKKVLEIDSLVIGLAKGRGSAIEAELLAMAKRKRFEHKFMDSDPKPQEHHLKGVY